MKKIPLVIFTLFAVVTIAVTQTNTEVEITSNCMIFDYKEDLVGTSNKENPATITANGIILTITNKEKIIDKVVYSEEMIIEVKEDLLVLKIGEVNLSIIKTKEAKKVADQIRSLIPKI